jgi:hypothetical protein
MKTLLKTVGYAYPTSPIAEELKQRNGCYYVATVEHAWDTEKKLISAHATVDEALTAAETMEEPFEFRFSLLRGDPATPAHHLTVRAYHGPIAAASLPRK